MSIDLIIISLSIIIIGWPASIIGLSIIQQTGTVLRQIAFDTIEIFARWEQSKYDIEKRQAELDYWIDKAQQEIHTQRQGLLSQ